MTAAGALRVLVVDDSALVRQTIHSVLAHEGFEVVTAADPLIAMERMKAAQPDVILLDLEMPRMDGLSFLRKIMSEHPLPVVICSAVAPRGSENALRALEEGAVDIVLKPQIGVQQFLYESAVTLADAVRGAAQARLPRRATWVQASAPIARPFPTAAEPSASVVALGASTGGTSALRQFLDNVDPQSPAIVIVQHMPRAFTAGFARGLDRTAAVHVREATHGDRLVRGVALLAPGDSHMRIVHAPRGGYAVELYSGPLVSRHRPSVDVLFESAAACFGPNAIGVILTGMGIDGASGLREMRRSGAFTIAQDEATSVVFGMPKEAIARGAVDSVLPLPEIAVAVNRRMVQTSRA